MARTIPLNISPSDYENPADTEARARLSQLTGLEEFTRDFISRVAEPWLSGELSGLALRVTRTQVPWLFNLTAELAALLDVPVPHVFVRQDPYLNAYTHGVGNQAFLAMNHSVIEQLELPELRFIIGHELGHIKSQHVLYTTMAHYLQQEASDQKSRFPAPLLLELINWQRESEITADRAGLLLCGDVESACLALLTLCVGTRNLARQIDVAEFVENQELALDFNPLARRMEQVQSHPFMPRRIKELLSFASSEKYAALLSDAITID